MASATKTLRLGLVTLQIFSISFNKLSFVCIRPAVSIKTTSILFFSAYFIAYYLDILFA
jgi:hypothetical protein